jgi:plasmid stabilization system protein ParE
LNVLILEKALRDLDEGYAFYERQSTGLGSYFEDSLFSDIDSLVVFAGVHSKVHGFYRALSKRFPFAIYYMMSDQQVLVHAVLDCRRDPTILGQRLSP